MLSGIDSMQEAIEKLKNAPNKREFDSVKDAVQTYMSRVGMQTESAELERRAFYFPNEYSDKDAGEKLEEAKNRTVQYLFELMGKTPEDDSILLRILENFHLFLEALWERVPNKRGGIQPVQLNAVRIKNEYDVQHLLYAYLKPLYPAARAEVSEDTGYEAVRPDIRLDDDRVIEVKCSRSEMKEKKLIEEIEADMVHYRASHIYFFVYDKEKIIENPKIFKNTYENKIKEKQVCIIIHQPKRL